MNVIVPVGITSVFKIYECACGLCLNEMLSRG